jgi:hypothetical protein
MITKSISSLGVPVGEDTEIAISSSGRSHVARGFIFPS